jgi:hypothetical protein
MVALSAMELVLITVKISNKCFYTILLKARNNFFKFIFYGQECVNNILEILSIYFLGEMSAFEPGDCIFKHSGSPGLDSNELIPADEPARQPYSYSVPTPPPP